MEDIMKQLTETTMNLSKWTKILNYWTIIVIIILPLTYLIHTFVFFAYEPFFCILALIYFLFLLIPLVVVPFIKDTQKQILLTIIRAFIGFIFPLPIIFLSSGPLALYLMILGGILFLVSLIICIFILLQVLTLNKLTKQLLQSQK